MQWTINVNINLSLTKRFQIQQYTFSIAQTSHIFYCLAQELKSQDKTINRFRTKPCTKLLTLTM